MALVREKENKKNPYIWLKQQVSSAIECAVSQFFMFSAGA